MSQIVELRAVASLPEEIQRDADNVVNNDESLENRVLLIKNLKAR